MTHNQDRYFTFDITVPCDTRSAIEVQQLHARAEHIVRSIDADIGGGPLRAHRVLTRAAGP